VSYEEYAAARLAGLLRYAHMLTGDPHLAGDIVQETMIQVQLKWRLVNRAESPDQYVRRMLTRAYLNWRRTSWLRRTVLSAEPVEPPPAPDHVEASAERDRMWALLGTLPRRQRAAVVLRYYEDLRDEEIAEVLGCAVGTVRAHISRAMATLRATLTPAPAAPSPTVPTHAGGGRE